MNIRCLNLALLQCYERGQRIIPQPALCCAFSMIIRPQKTEKRIIGCVKMDLQSQYKPHHILYLV